MTPPPDPADAQPELLPGLVRATARQARAAASASRKRTAATAALAEVDPVARVLIDVPLAHLDRPFDYAVPATMSDQARPGTRVKVRFAGQDVDGFVLERVAESEHPGRLSTLRRVVSPEPVLTAAVADLAAAVAERYAGTRSDVLRLAIPPRHATVEKEASLPAPPAQHDHEAARGAWQSHRFGPAFVDAVRAGQPARAVWSAAPGTDWPDLLAYAASAALEAGRGSILCVPDARDLHRLDAAMRRVLGADQHVMLTAGVGPSARYRDFLAVSRGARRIVIGTRSAAFAPVADLGLLAIWDDGDDLHAEPRAPYPHTREVLLVRAEQAGAAMLVGGFARTVEAAYLVRTGWAREVAAEREVLRRRLVVTVCGATDHDLQRDVHARRARLPGQAHAAIRAGLERGPVLVQTPRAGYAAALACERCRAPASCRACVGPLRLSAALAPPDCRWCGTAHPGWQCPSCGHRGLRAPVLGEARTAEELGRTFPGARVLSSSGEQALTEVSGPGAIVVATPGAEPVAQDGYATVVLLDTWLALARAEMRAEEEALRRWMNAAGLIRPGGQVVVVGDAAHRAVQALVRWDPAGFAERETGERSSAHLPPASRLASITGSPGAVDDALTVLSVPPPVEVLGPVPIEDDEVRALIRVPRAGGRALSIALGELQRVRSARKLDPVRIEVDPAVL